MLVYCIICYTFMVRPLADQRVFFIKHKVRPFTLISLKLHPGSSPLLTTTWAWGHESFPEYQWPTAGQGGKLWIQAQDEGDALSFTYCTRFQSSGPGCGRTWTAGWPSGGSSPRCHPLACSEFWAQPGTLERHCPHEDPLEAGCCNSERETLEAALWSQFFPQPSPTWLWDDDFLKRYIDQFYVMAHSVSERTCYSNLLGNTCSWFLSQCRHTSIQWSE